MSISSGGYRIKKKLRQGQAILIDALITQYGGSAELATKLKVKPQTIRNWRNLGCVPPHSMADIVTKLELSPWALNYKFLAKLFPGQAPSWEEVVECTLEEDSLRELVLAGISPDL